MQERRKILFYGDSNTYGYDPADMYELRYPAGKRWTDLLQEMCADTWQVLPEGMNGRKLPDLAYDRRRLMALVQKLSKEDIFAVMLGTNDLLMAVGDGPENAVQKMDALLGFLTGQMDSGRILVIAPPHIGGSRIRDPLYRSFYEWSIRMNAGFRETAARYGVLFADAGTWDIELCFDLVHFSEAGHRTFAGKMYQLLSAEEPDE